VLRHRIITNFNAEAEGIKPDDIVKRLADMIPRDPNEEQLAKGARVGTPPPLTASRGEKV
jgi:hypothetical protein